jgi:5-methylcytosine-specific restriction endonuclease McrA
MNYQKLYDQLIERAKLRVLDGYCEKHHIVPKSLGGSNNKENIVSLTAREHFLAHWLLFKIYQCPAMAKAFRLMLDHQKSGKAKITNRQNVFMLCLWLEAQMYQSAQK